MRIGTSFPTTEIGNNPQDIRAFARGVEALGFDYMTCIDHVIQGREAVADDWRAYYTIDNPFHEIMVLSGFIAAITERIEIASSILILPQRPTVLVAKQFAELDVLTGGGRVRAGVGLGWNKLEFDALGQDFGERVTRMEEQVGWLRALWSGGTVSFDNGRERVVDAGLNPAPMNRSIPIWFGAFVPRAIRRAGRLADGLFINPRTKPDAQGQAEIEMFRTAASKAGRDASALGLDVTIITEARSADELREEYEQWRELGVTHLTLRTMTAGYTEVNQHLDALAKARDAVGN